MPHLDQFSLRKQAKKEGQEHESCLGEEQEPLSVMTVGDSSAQQAEANCGDRPKEPVEAKLKGRAGNLVKKPANGRDLHPGADVRYEEARP